jgi:hypothetical protein
MARSFRLPNSLRTRLLTMRTCEVKTIKAA